MPQYTDIEWSKAIDELLLRSASDPAFRALALQDSAAALRTITAKPPPKGTVYRFIDNSGPDRTIPLPDLLPDIEELPDLDLELVSGGEIECPVGVTWRR